MWYCQKCSEELPVSFQVCWNCGTSRDGIEDPTFEAVVDEEDTSADVPTGKFYHRAILACFVALVLAAVFLQFTGPVMASSAAVAIASILIGVITAGDAVQRCVAGAICVGLLLPVVLSVSVVIDKLF